MSLPKHREDGDANSPQRSSAGPTLPVATITPAATDDRDRGEHDFVCSCSSLALDPRVGEPKANYDCLGVSERARRIGTDRPQPGRHKSMLLLPSFAPSVSLPALSATLSRAWAAKDRVRFVSYPYKVLRRTFKYRLYPTARQERLLVEQLGFTRDLYNAALEQRITAFELTGRAPSYLEQSSEFTRLRADCPEWLPMGMSRSAQQYALRRLDGAFQGFFSRLRRGQKPGFPRFKAARRWDTLSCQYDKGCKLRHEIGRPYWAGVGNVKLKQHRAIPESAERKKVDRDVNAARNILRLGESQQRMSGCEIHLLHAA